MPNSAFPVSLLEGLIPRPNSDSVSPDLWGMTKRFTHGHVTRNTLPGRSPWMVEVFTPEGERQCEWAGTKAKAEKALAFLLSL